MLVRYADSPVGPYDELLWLERVKTRQGWRPCVQQIVVSSAASVAGGRRNWAIPKTLARFDWSAGRVKVSTAPGSPGVVLSFGGVQGAGIPLSLRLLPRLARTLSQRGAAGQEFCTTIGGSGRLRRAHLRVEAAPGWPALLNRQKPLLVLGVPEFRLTFPPAHVR